MDNKINPETIRNILTLRYHPSKNFYLPNLGWQDFEPKDNDDYVEKTESYLKDTIQNFITKEKPKKISIALSGGVDSNKRGFTPDYIKLWKNFGKNIVKTYLLDGRVIKDGWINLDWVQKAFKKVTETQDLRYINKLLHVTSFEIWYRLFITNEMSKDDKLI